MAKTNTNTNPDFLSGGSGMDEYRSVFNSTGQSFVCCELVRNKEGKGIDYNTLELNPTQIQSKLSIEMLLGKSIDTFAFVVDNQCPIEFEQYFEVNNSWHAVKVYPGEKDRFTVWFSDISKRKHRKANLGFLAGINLDFAPQLTAQEVMHFVAEKLATFLHLSRCVFSIIDEAQDRVEAVYEYRSDEKLPSLVGLHSISDNITEEGRRHYNAGKVVVLNSITDSPLVKAPAQRLTDMGIGSLVVLPHLEAGKWKFLLTVARAEVSAWRSDELELLQELTSRIYIRMERARVEEALLKSEEKYRTLFTSIDQGFTLCELIRNKEGKGIDFYMLEVNPTYEEQTGVSKEMVLGKAIIQVFPSMENWIDTYAAVVDNQCPVVFERYFEDTDRWFALKAYPVGKEMFAVLFSNITERKLAEEKIKESEKEIREVSEQLELSIRAGKIGIWHWDVKEDNLTWSKEQKEIYGFSASEVITNASQFNALIFPEDLNRIQVDQSTGVLDHEYDFRINRKNDGELRWIKSRARNTLDPQGVLQFISGVNIDVTEQVLATNKIKESEEAFAQQKQLLESVTENTDMALFLMDEKQYCIYMNHAAEKMTGFTLEELKGKQLHYHVHHSHPDGSPFPLEECPIDQALPTQNRKKGEEVFVHKNGSFYPVAFTASPITVNNNVIGTVLEVRETTEEKRKEQELKESESRFRSLADESPMFVYLVDPGPLAFVSYWNKTWLTYTGQNAEQAAGTAWDKIIHTEDIAVVMDFYKPAFAAKQPFVIPAVRTKRYDGAFRWHTYKCNPRYLPNGEFNGYIGVGFDIHDQKLAEEKIKESEKLLEQKIITRTAQLEEKNIELKKMNVELEAFTYVSSHDLQEPLRKIQTFAGRIKDQEIEQLSDTSKDYFNRMQEAASRMQTLIDDLLAFSRINTSERKFEMTDLSKIVEEVKEAFKETMEEKNASIKVADMGEVNVILFQFHQLMYNLIGNALKFSKPDVPPHIFIKSTIAKGSELNCEKLLPENDYCHISVSDNSIGFEEHFSEKIFGVFQKLHGRSEYEGTGIGLAIVKKIVDNHNGIINAESKLGKGTTFNIYLPNPPASP